MKLEFQISASFRYLVLLRFALCAVTYMYMYFTDMNEELRSHELSLMLQNHMIIIMLDSLSDGSCVELH